MSGPGSPVVILHVIEGLGTGGSEQQLAAFLRHSDRMRFRHEVCTLAQVGRHAAELEKAGINVHTLGLRDDGDSPRAMVGLLRVVRQVRPQIIHSVLYRPTIVSRIVGGLSRTPVVTTLVNTTYEPEWRFDNPRLSPGKVWLVQTIDRVTARWWGERYIAISESVKTSAVRRIGIFQGKIAVIPRGLVFPERLQGPDVATLRVALGWTDAYPVVLNVARLVPQKGQQYAIRAMHQVRRRFPSARLIIAGEGPLRSTLERLIREEGLGECVSLLGERRDADVLLRAADVFAFPSLFEGLGNALLEAMAAGKPCVVSRIPTLEEVTQDGKVALLAAPRSPEDLADKVVKLAEDRALRERLGAAAQERVRTHYSLGRSVAAWEAVYEGIMASSGSGQQTPGSHSLEGSVRQPLGQRWGMAMLLAALREIGGGREGVLHVLLYHRVCDPARGYWGDPHVLSATPEAFDEQMGYIARHYHPVAASEVSAALRGEASLPRRAVLVTFDDGYRDFLTEAWPVLRRHRVPALLFVPTAFPGTSDRFWWDELYESVAMAAVPELRLFGLGPFPLRTPRERWNAVRTLNRFLKHLPPVELRAKLQELREVLGTPKTGGSMVMTWEEIRSLVEEGLAVGSHTRTHAALPYLTNAQVAEEIESAHASLRDRLDAPVSFFSYPFGMADSRAAAMLRQLGYAGAFGSLFGRNVLGRRSTYLMYRRSVDAGDSLIRVAASLTAVSGGLREVGRAVKTRLWLMHPRRAPA